jgi:hypothetical protein
VTALAAGHRPCFECRRHDAIEFAECWRRGLRLPARPRAADMDERLHEERLSRAGESRAALNSRATEAVGTAHPQARDKRRHARSIADLPDGAFIVIEGRAFAMRGRSLLYWAPDGYATRRQRPRSGTVDVLTPPSIIAALSAGYNPRWHPSCVEDGAGHC